MKKIMLLLFIIFVACTQDLEITQPDVPNNQDYSNHPDHQTYQEALEKYALDTKSPGAILLIAKPDEPIWIGATGYSNLAYFTQTGTHTPFRAGSVTKMITSVIILKLVEEDRITLEDRLNELLPETSGRIPDAEKITVRYLLAHLSGIVDPPNESLIYQGDIINNPQKMISMSVDEKLEQYVYGKKLKFEPGTAYSYSNTNYLLLGKIAVNLTGKTFSQLASEMVFSPLGMSESYIEKRDDRNVARGYVDYYNNGKLMDVTLWDRAEGEEEADGGLISTAEDLYRFMNGLFHGDLISEELLREMKTIQFPDCNSVYCEYGLGLEIWRTQAGFAYGHNGALVGLEANVLYYEEYESVLVLYKNNGNFSDKSFMDALVLN